MDAQTLSELANEILFKAGFGRCKGPFTAEVAWQAHRRANERQAASTLLRALLDLEDAAGVGSVEEAIVQCIVNCGPIQLDLYPVPPQTWSALGFEVYTHGDGSQGAHIPLWLRSDAGTAH
jgi:hypothetical protein